MRNIDDILTYITSGLMCIGLICLNPRVLFNPVGSKLTSFPCTQIRHIIIKLRPFCVNIRTNLLSNSGFIDERLKKLLDHITYSFSFEL